MQDIHKNWRNFLHEAQRPEPVIKQTTLTEEELVLIGESRVEDAKKKSPKESTSPLLLPVAHTFQPLVPPPVCLITV